METQCKTGRRGERTRWFPSRAMQWTKGKLCTKEVVQHSWHLSTIKRFQLSYGHSLVWRMQRFTNQIIVSMQCVSRACIRTMLMDLAHLRTDIFTNDHAQARYDTWTYVSQQRYIGTAKQCFTSISTHTGWHSTTKPPCKLQLSAAPWPWSEPSSIHAEANFLPISLEHSASFGIGIYTRELQKQSSRPCRSQDKHQQRS